MSEKYYQEYGPMRRRRGSGQKPGTTEPLELVNEPLEPEDQEPVVSRHTLAPPRTRRSPLRLFISTILVVLAILAMPYLLAYALPLLSGDQVPAGISIQGTAVGGMRREQIEAVLTEQYRDISAAPLRLTYENQTWEPSMRDLGARIDVERTAELALNIGASENPLERIRNWWQLSRGGLDLAPVIQIDANTLQQYLLQVSDAIEQPPRDAAVSIAAGKVLPTSARIGRQMLIDQTSIEVMQTLQSLQSHTIAIRTRTLMPQIDDAGIVAAVDEARLLLKRPLRLRQGTRDWTWDEERIANLIAIRAEQGTLITEIDQERLARQVEKLAQIVDSGSSEPRLAFRAGEVAIIEPGQTGLRLKQSEAIEAIVAALQSDLHLVNLPTEEVQPNVTEATLPSLGIIELVSEGQSSFAGSASYRVTNIKAGAARMNGVLIPPDAEFSFNTQLGEVDEKHGFVQGYAVIGNRTQLEWGGGVCQVSTTVFRAAFWGGVPITERHAHPFYISWYDRFSFPNDAAPGMDATIFTGALDLKFSNDTGNWLLMQATVDEADQVLRIQLYGTRPNRIVQVVGPEISNQVNPPAQPVYITDDTLPAGTVKQTDQARRGMDISVYRVITNNGVKQEPELFFTRFKAWPDVFVRGIGSP
jgi:vancomycin resistance protein YoaR